MLCFLKEGIEWKIFSLHHLIGFMGGLQVNSLVFTSQKRKKDCPFFQSFSVFLFIFQFLNQCKKFCLRDRFYHFIDQDFPFPIQYFWQINTIFTNIVLMFL